MAFDIRSLYDTEFQANPGPVAQGTSMALDAITRRAYNDSNRQAQLAYQQRVGTAQAEDARYRDAMGGLFDTYDANSASADRLMQMAEAGLGDMRGLTKKSQAWKEADREYWDEVYDPTVRQFQRAAREGVEADFEGEMDRAEADVAMQHRIANDAQARRMARMGVNPTSGRFVSSQRAGDMAAALGRAGARTGARLNEKRRVEDTNFARLQAGASMAGRRGDINLNSEMAGLGDVTRGATSLADRYADATARTAAGLSELDKQRKMAIGGAGRLV